MWPWGHAAVGYLAYTLACRARGERPTSPAVFALALGTQFPDLVDKPLAWTFGVLPTGRTLAHSLVVTGLLLAVAYRLASPSVRRVGVVPFGVGTVSHSLADLGPGILGDPSGATYLLWPVLPSPEYTLGQSFWAHLVAFEFTPYTWVQFGLGALAVVAWVADGRPGLAPVWARCRRLRAEG